MPVSSAPQRTYRLRRRLLLLVTLLVTLVMANGAATVLMGLSSRSAILAAHDLEVASRRAALLSVIAREQYIHEAHTIILRDRSHVEHHDAWVHKLRSELDELLLGGVAIGSVGGVELFDEFLDLRGGGPRRDGDH